ncbi:antitoxin Xre/MbcA/ParS toxin-binding domain-containing protein [Pseudomonas sp. S30_BP2TU TE3576]|uniref:antitoxin Xre/MbcA/ParS toxin-binding domain-containing protein n=1 Tax=Pseudomonas sp. S30_BP2TU TE3576 TaxID=3349329 RepID=UPI003D21A26B
MARRANTGRFSTVESERLVALIAVFENALTQFEDDVTAATEWMSSPTRGLGSKRPLEMLRTRVETNAVLDFICRLQWGVRV